MCCWHNSDVIMGAMVSKITSLTSVHSTVYLGADQRKHQSSASLAFVRGIHWWPVNSPHKWLSTRKMFPLITSSSAEISYFDLNCMKIVREGWNGNMSALVHIMVWHRTGNRPLSKLFMTTLWYHWAQSVNFVDNCPINVIGADSI